MKRSIKHTNHRSSTNGSISISINSVLAADQRLNTGVLDSPMHQLPAGAVLLG